jgi:hypothetical protein
MWWMMESFWPTFVTFMFLSAANGFISLAVTKSQVFTPFRDFFFNRATQTRWGKFMAWLYDLVSCPYCFSHWVALVMIAVWQPVFTNCGYTLTWRVFGIENLPIFDLLVSLFAMVAVASYSWGIFYKITSGGEDEN